MCAHAYTKYNLGNMFKNLLCINIGSKVMKCYGLPEFCDIFRICDLYRYPLLNSLLNKVCLILERIYQKPMQMSGTKDCMSKVDLYGHERRHLTQFLIAA